MNKTLAAVNALLDGLQLERYTDTGAFQLYGNAQDVVVKGNTFERATGLFSWVLAESDHDYCPNLRVRPCIHVPGLNKSQKTKAASRAVRVFVLVGMFVSTV